MKSGNGHLKKLINNSTKIRCIPISYHIKFNLEKNFKQVQIDVKHLKLVFYLKKNISVNIEPIHEGAFMTDGN